MTISAQDARRAVEGYFGRSPDKVDWPGGRSRRSFCVQYGQDRYVVSRRGGPGRAKLEATILGKLGGTGLTPNLVACSEEWVIQSWVDGERLAERLERAPSPSLVRQTAFSLAKLQAAGTDAGLDTIAPVIGTKEGWTDRFLGLPAVLAERCDLAIPEFDSPAIRKALASPPRSFVKWDARPGNALIQSTDDRPVWIDWEHAGCRVTADDLAWLVCDEWFPDDPELETAAITGFRDAYRDRFDYDFEHYLALFGCLHLTVRISLILGSQRDTGWGDRTRLLALDRIGATPELLLRLARRGARWAARSPETEGLKSFFSEIGIATFQHEGPDSEAP